jgi:Tn3 transposase DDE domain
MLEVGRAQRTIFVARYLGDRQLQREITEGLNVVEAFSRANSVIYYGKGSEISSNRADEQEMSVACLRILQAALVYVNTLLLQDVLGRSGLTCSPSRTGGADAAVLAAHSPLRRSQARHDHTPGHPHRHASDAPVRGSLSRR